MPTIDAEGVIPCELHGPLCVDTIHLLVPGSEPDLVVGLVEKTGSACTLKI